MIGQDSRYASAKVVTTTDPNGEPRQEMRVAFPSPRLISYTYYRVSSGERADTIAWDFYGRADLWWLIADANPEIIDWFDLPVGEVLRVPSG